MVRSFSRRRPLQAVTEINVTPLLDLAFALLIIFMIAAPLLEQSIEVELPVAQSGTPPGSERPTVQRISIDAQGRIFWGDEGVTLAVLDQRLAEAALLPSPPILALRGDAAVRYQAVIDVLDAIKRHNLRRLMLDTRAP